MLAFCLTLVGLSSLSCDTPVTSEVSKTKWQIGIFKDQ